MFTPETLEFIAENCWQSSRDWFYEHRNEYLKFVRNPLIELSDFLAPTVEEIDPQLVTDAKVTIARINRDLRFARGGSLYRDTLWISYRRDRQSFQAWPEFYFILSPRMSFYGCGYYQTKAPVIAEIRKMVLEDHPKYLAAKKALDSQSEFALDGEMYKRSKFKDAPEDKKQWLDRKTLRFTYIPKGEELFSHGLGEKIKEIYKKMAPIYEFLVFAEEEATKS
ncbi:MAG: DUF2461 domain-containing protein [Clostridia bacterium]|nr:DUF2461 domain-containing protein [Clostridia bacterium]